MALKKRDPQPLNEDNECFCKRLKGKTSEVSSTLPISIDKILNENGTFDLCINHMLMALGDAINCSRIVLYRHDLTDSFNDFKIWANGFVSTTATIDLPVDWQKIKCLLGNADGALGELCFDNLNVPQPLAALFPLINSQPSSVLLWPLMDGNKPLGFVAFEEICYKRVWQKNEKEVLSVAIKMIGYSLQREYKNIETEKRDKLNHFLIQVSEMFQNNDSIESQINQSLEFISSQFGFLRMAIFENSDEDLCQLTYQWAAKPTAAFGEQFHQLSYSKQLAGLKEALKVNSIISHGDASIVDAVDFLNTGPGSSKLFLPIHYSQKIHGFICIDHLHLEREWLEFELDALIVATNLIASALSVSIQMQDSERETGLVTKLLTEKEQFLQTILSTIPLGILLIRNKEIIYANELLQNMARLSEQKIVGMSISDFYFSDQEREEKSDLFYSQIERYGFVQMEMAMKAFDGALVYTNVIGKLCPINGYTDSYLAIAENITALKKTQIELNESEVRSQIILETSIEGVFIFESAETLLYVNDAGCHLLGYSKSQIYESNLKELFGAEDIAEKYVEAIQIIKSGQNYQSDAKVRNSKGELLFIDVFGTPIIIKGKTQYYLSFRNISERKRKEEELIFSEKKYRTLTENTKDFIIRIGVDGKLLFGNHLFFDFYNLNIEESVGFEMEHLKGLPQFFRETILTVEKSMVSLADSQHVEIVSHLGDEEFYVEWAIWPETDGSDTIVSYLCVGRDTTQRKISERELLVAKEKAESADRLKSAFLANMSHEIRTPLNAIVGFSSFLKDEELSRDDKEEYIDVINKSADSLMSLIGDIIEIAKIESGEFKISKKVFNVDLLLKDIYAVFKNKMDRNNNTSVDLILDLPPSTSEPLIESDPNKFTQVLNNLIDNAIKFTAKGSITFGYVREGGSYTFFVKDSGIGIEKESLDVILQPFRQADYSINKRFGGSGLGLAISNHLAKALNGELLIESTPQQGSVFSIKLPDTILPNQGLENNFFCSWQPNMSHSKNRNYDWSNKTIVLVDDSDAIYLQLKKYLEKTGIKLVCDRASLSAHELLMNNPIIDIILVDFQLSSMNNHSLVTAIKRENKNLPVVAILAAELALNRESCLVNGFDEGIEKPIHRFNLIETMNHVFNRFDKN